MYLAARECTTVRGIYNDGFDALQLIACDPDAAGCAPFELFEDRAHPGGRYVVIDSCVRRGYGEWEDRRPRG